MKKLGKELIFISFIKRDGTGTVMVGGEWNSNMDIPKIDDMGYLDQDVFDVICLSLTEKTFLASGFNSFVVKLKPEIPTECKHPFKSVIQKNGESYCTICEKYL